MIRPPSHVRFLLVIRVVLGLSLAWLFFRGDATATLIVGIFLAFSFAYRLRIRAQGVRRALRAGGPDGYLRLRDRPLQRGRALQ